MRQVMVDQFEREERGPMYVRDGDLHWPRVPLQFSPNFPCYDGYHPVQSAAQPTAA